MKASKSYVQNVRFSPSELSELRRVAEERCTSVGSVVRWAVKATVLSDPPENELRESATVLETDGALPLVQS